MQEFAEDLQHVKNSASSPAFALPGRRSTSFRTAPGIDVDEYSCMYRLLPLDDGITYR